MLDLGLARGVSGIIETGSAPHRHSKQADRVGWGIVRPAILDAEGKVLATSNGPDGQNYGFPTEPDEIKHFVGMLKSTGARLTGDDAHTLIRELTSPCFHR